MILPALLAACAVRDSHIAQDARISMMNMSEVDLESCLGVPDQHSTFGTTDILTYYASSASSTSYSAPIVGGIGFSNGGYCHATFTLRNHHVTKLLYSGEKNATLAPDAYCAPIMRTCLKQLRSAAGRGANDPASRGANNPAGPGSNDPAGPPANSPPGTGSKSAGGRPQTAS